MIGMDFDELLKFGGDFIFGDSLNGEDDFFIRWGGRQSPGLDLFLCPGVEAFEEFVFVLSGGALDDFGLGDAVFTEGEDFKDGVVAEGFGDVLVHPV